jgi:hypothetical protein
MSIKKPLVLTLCLALVPIAASAQLTDRAEILKGHVSVVQLTATDLVVTVDARLDLDGIIEDAFVFRTDVPLPGDVPQIDDFARVIVRPNSILILPENGPNVALAVGSPGVRSRRLQPRGMVVLDQGFELSHVRGNFDLDPYTLATELLESRPGAGIVAGDEGVSALFQAATDGCISGGDGADSCSLDGDIDIAGTGGGVGCSVGCRSGYDACCSITGCHCEAN